MKHDLEIIRKILINLNSYQNKEIDDANINYHFNLLIDLKLIKQPSILRDGQLRYYTELNYTEKGYDLLTHISNNTVWESIKKTLYENNFTVSEVPIEVIKKLSEKIMMDMFGGKQNGSSI